MDYVLAGPCEGVKASLKPMIMTGEASTQTSVFALIAEPSIGKKTAGPKVMSS